MGSQTLSILRQGIWASLTGGWYYDPKQSHFSNVFHLYLWLLFVCLPFTIRIGTTSWIPWLIYCLVIGILFTAIKLINAYFHHLFDHGECVVEDSSSHKSDDEVNIEDGISNQNDKNKVISNEHEHIEMMVLGQDESVNKDQFTNDPVHEQHSDMQISLSTANNDANQNGNRDFSNSITNPQSIIDLEVDVHHRNSSGSSIGVSEKTKSQNEEDHNQSAKIDNLSNTNQSDLLMSNSPNLETSQHLNVSSSINLSNESTEISSSCDPIMKSGALLELGFMAQDPAAMRTANDSQLRNKRAENVVRRARSELETIQCSDKNSPSSMPSSHPVSLEVIGTRHTGDISNDDDKSESSQNGHTSSEHIKRSNFSENIKPIDEVVADENYSIAQSKIDNSKTKIDNSKAEIEADTSENKSPSKEINMIETSKMTEIRSTDDEGDESDVSLVVNASKSKKKKIKGVKRKTLSRKRVSKSTSLGKIHSFSKKPIDKLGSGDVDMNKRSALHLMNVSSDSEIESSHNKSDSCSSSNKASLSISSSNSSADEKTLLTNSIVNPDSDDKSASSKPNTSLYDLKCVAGPSRMFINENEIGKPILSTFSRTNNEQELNRLRNELQKREKQTRIKNAVSVSNHNRELTESNERTSLVLSNTLESPGVFSSENGPPPYLLARILSVPGTHLARSHEDTNTGAVHVFQDERGNWLTYTFDENSTGVARGLMNSDRALLDLKYDLYSKNRKSFDSTSSGSTVVLDTPGFLHTPKYSNCSGDYTRILQSNANALFAESFPITAFSRLGTNRRFELNTSSLLFNQQTSNTNNNLHSDLYPMRYGDFPSPDQPQHKPKQYYKLWILPFKHIKVRFDRLTLLALLDRSLTKFELGVSIVLALLVAIFGSILLQKSFFYDLWLFIFCLVIASCHYTLIKSVQPDAASPTHGYNRVTLYSRPIYFCLSSAILLLAQSYLDGSEKHLSFTLYGKDLLNEQVIHMIRDANLVFLLSFPILFSFGLLPQISTFLMYLFEQIDVNLFGGTAVTGLISSMYCLSRSIISLSFLYAFALISLQEPVFTQNVTFSIFCGLLIANCYFLSRSSSDPSIFWNLFKQCFKCNAAKQKLCNSQNEKSEEENVQMNESKNEDSQETEITDPLPSKLEQTLLIRLQSDIIICIFIVIVVFATHVSTIFTLQPYVEICVNLWAVILGFILHYFMNHFRKQLPWLCFANPVMKTKEYNLYEVKDAAKLMWFEKIYAWLWLIEKNVIYQLVFLSSITNDAPLILNKFGFKLGTFILVLCGFKCIRSTFNDPSSNYIILLFTYLFFKFDFSSIAEPFLINYFILSIAFHKFYELLLKVRFIITYVAPWQITWGSAFHAFAQPFSVPHSAMLFVQAIMSSILSSPLQPILGSAIFFVSYVRPIKFWERDYNTKRVDHSNTRLASQLEKTQLGADDNNLNSIFYEHLTRSLQHSLYGDLALGRWGLVSQGDCFVLASDNLNCLVHIIELGNGLVTFQVRGLEFRGTYCQQREVEAISEGVSEDEGCCCCEPGHLPGTLSINAAFNQRWLAWEVTHTKYVLEGYSITDNSAVTMLQPYDLRKALITYYIKSIIYFCITSNNLEKWIEQQEIKTALESMKDPNYVDLDPIFNASIDEDYDFRLSGITKSSFCQIYLEWIHHCIEQRNKDPKTKIEINTDKENAIIALCFCLSLLARRALSAASHHNSFTSVEFLLYGLHSLFKGDFRITSLRDEWVFQDMNLIRKVVAPSVRMALRLHQDHFMSADEYDDNYALFDNIRNYQKFLIISHEADPIWRNAVLSNVPSLLALRHVFDDGTDQYKIIQLNKRYLSFRVIKINRECVRGLWAGQQQELIYLRNRNPERGSIQNAKQALRNIINSSCDQPIGYPIYVSPLTTSFNETNEQLCKVIGSPLSIGMFKRFALRLWERIRTRCGEGCSSGQINSHDACHRGDTFTFERATGTRGSTFSETSTEYDSNQYLCRRTRTPQSYSYRNKYPHRKYSTAGLNLTSFKPTQSQSNDTTEHDVILQKTSKTFTPKGELV